MMGPSARSSCGLVLREKIPDAEQEEENVETVFEKHAGDLIQR
jgi:hypothetical protein